MHFRKKREKKEPEMSQRKKSHLKLQPTPKHSSRHRIKSSFHWGQQRFPLTARYTALSPLLQIVSFSWGQALSAAVWVEILGCCLCSAAPQQLPGPQRNTRETGSVHRNHKRTEHSQPQLILCTPFRRFKHLSVHGFYAPFCSQTSLSIDEKNQPDKVRWRAAGEKMRIYD